MEPVNITMVEPIHCKENDKPHTKSNNVCYTTVELTHRYLKAYMDLTGRFPLQSSRGNNYILVSYHYDSNGILAEPLQNRTASLITKAWSKLNTIYANQESNQIQMC